MVPLNIGLIKCASWYSAAITHFTHDFCPMFDREKERIQLGNAIESKRRRLRSRFGGVIEELIRVIAVRFRYLAQVLDACSKRCPKTDH